MTHHVPGNKNFTSPPFGEIFRYTLSVISEPFYNKNTNKSMPKFLNKINNFQIISFFSNFEESWGVEHRHCLVKISIYLKIFFD